MTSLVDAVVVTVPDYHWEQHANSISESTASRRKPPPRSSPSDMTDDHPPRLSLASHTRSAGPKKRPPPVETESDSEEEALDEETVEGFNWVTQKPMRIRNRSDAGGRRDSKRRRVVRFARAPPKFWNAAALTDEDRSNIYWTQAELCSFRLDRDDERAEKQRHKRESTHSNATASMASVWGSSPARAVVVDEKAMAEKAQREADKKEKEAKAAAEMASLLDGLQLAMKQAQLVTGF